MKLKGNRSNLASLLEESVELLKDEHAHTAHDAGSVAGCPVCGFLSKVLDEQPAASPYELLSTRALSLHVDRLLARSA